MRNTPSPCALCENEECVEQSHIVPAFAYRHLKRISPNGHIRGTEMPNRRVNDGAKTLFLGPNCEDRFSKWEREFASNVFHPVQDGELSNRTLAYGTWLAKFAVSVTWRCLAHRRAIEGASLQLPFGHETLVNSTLRMWQQFLLGERADVGHHRHHMIFLDDPISLPRHLNPFDLSNYLQRGIDSNTIHAPDEAYVIVKMCKVMIVGTIFTRKPSAWQRTQIQVAGGAYNPGDFQVSGCVFTFFETALREIAECRERISPTQADKIEKSVREKIEELKRAHERP